MLDVGSPAAASIPRATGPAPLGGGPRSSDGRERGRLAGHALRLRGRAPRLHGGDAPFDGQGSRSGFGCRRPRVREAAPASVRRAGRRSTGETFSIGLPVRDVGPLDDGSGSLGRRSLVFFCVTSEWSACRLPARNSRTVHLCQRVPCLRLFREGGTGAGDDEPEAASAADGADSTRDGLRSACRPGPWLTVRELRIPWTRCSIPRTTCPRPLWRWRVSSRWTRSSTPRTRNATPSG